MSAICSHTASIELTELPEAIAGRQECLAIGGTSVHLRMCQTCGRIGCCDSSPHRHASAHARTSQHPIAAPPSRERTGAGATWTESRSWSPGGDSDTARTVLISTVIEYLKEQVMADAPGQQPSSQPPPGSATVAEVMQPPLTTVKQDDHVAAAAYVMKHAGATALVVVDEWTDQPLGIITEADIAHAVADGKDLSSVRIHDLMTTRPTVINTTTSVRDAAKTMTSGHFRHLPVVGDAGLVGMVDIVDVCRALIDSVISRQPGTGVAQPD